ncbi:SPOR domain-containing protein [Kaarinaea lacus]
MNDQLKQRLVGAIVLVSLAVIILPEIFKGDSSDLVSKGVPEEPDYRFPPPAETPKAPPMATAPVVPLDEPSKKADTTNSGKQATQEPADSQVVEKVPDKKSSAVKAQAKEKETKSSTEPALSRPGKVDAFVVQVGSFSSEPNALALRDRLRKMGFACFVEAIKGDQGMVYRVRVGPELTRELADKLQIELAKKAKVNGLVQGYP